MKEQTPKKKMPLQETGLRAQNILTILGSIVNIIWRDLYYHLMSSRMFTLTKKDKVFI